MRRSSTWGSSRWGWRVVEYAATLLIVITLVFALPRLMPGDAFGLSTGDVEGAEGYTLQQQAYFVEYYGLDRPFLAQYGSYLAGVVRGDLGESYYFKRPVADVVAQRLPWTLLLVSGGIALSLLLGIALGSFSAWRRGGWPDRFLYVFMVAFGEIPAFMIGLVLLIGVGAGLGLFPLSGAMTPFSSDMDLLERVGDVARHAALPVLTLGLARSAGIYLLVRNSLGTVLTRDYMVTARAKGLAPRRIRYRHALRNALLPLVTRLALQMGAVVGGAVLVENVFAYPGLGALMRDAVTVRDYPLLQGIFLVMTAGVLLANLAADVAYRRLDPRTRTSMPGPTGGDEGAPRDGGGR